MSFGGYCSIPAEVSFWATMLATNIFLRFSQTSLGVLASRMNTCCQASLGVLAKNVIVNTCCQSIFYPTRSLLPWRIVSICDGRFIFKSPFNVTLVTLSYKVLVYLVVPSEKLLQSSFSLGSELPICIRSCWCGFFLFQLFSLRSCTLVT